jgi:hypothetical protein
LMFIVLLNTAMGKTMYQMIRTRQRWSMEGRGNWKPMPSVRAWFARRLINPL